MKNQWLHVRIILLSGFLGFSVFMTGCASEKTLSKAEQVIQTEVKVKEKQEMVEKKILSDFQNKAYKIYNLKQLSELPAVLDKEIKKLSQENAVKMFLNFELAQRMALQNDPYYGAISGELVKAIGQSQPDGVIALNQLVISDLELKKEIEIIKKSLFSLYKDQTGIYRIVDYQELQKYKSYISDECVGYITYMASESSMPSIRNKCLVIDREEAWRRLVYLDNYFTNYPVPSDDLIRNNLGKYYQDLLKNLIYGDDLKPNFDAKTGQLTPEVAQFFASHQFGSDSDLYIPFENFKTQLIADKGLLTPTVGIHIQQLLRIVSEILTEHID